MELRAGNKGEGAAYVDDALDACLLHRLAGRHLVDVLVVLPPALPRNRFQRHELNLSMLHAQCRSPLAAAARGYLGEDHVPPVGPGDHEHLRLLGVALVVLLHPVRHAPAHPRSRR
jgi:hypothetical protein